ncbi:TIGR02530 family flagellar biosynthesis protein [Lachnospiraceae bacterium LCP25S3_G4]
MIHNINQITTAKQLQLQREVELKNGKSFEEILKKQLCNKEGVQFSKHATQRVEQRGIEMSEHVLNGLNQAVDKARSKGAKDVVVIGDNGAFIVNVPNNIVVTTVDKNEMKDNIFVNIDSAVLL